MGPADVIITGAHQIVGALLLACAVLLMVWNHQLLSSVDGCSTKSFYPMQRLYACPVSNLASATESAGHYSGAVLTIANGRKECFFAYFH